MRSRPRRSSCRVRLLSNASRVSRTTICPGAAVRHRRDCRMIAVEAVRIVGAMAAALADDDRRLVCDFGRVGLRWSGNGKQKWRCADDAAKNAHCGAPSGGPVALDRARLRSLATGGPGRRIRSRPPVPFGIAFPPLLPYIRAISHAGLKPLTGFPVAVAIWHLAISRGGQNRRILWRFPIFRCASCLRLACISVTRHTAGTRRWAPTSTAPATTSTSSTSRRPCRCCTARCSR